MSMVIILGALALLALAFGATDAGSQTGGEPGKSADDQGTGGGTDTQSKSGEGQTGAGTGQTTGGDAGQTADEKKFTQADIDRVVKERLAEEQKRQQKKADDEKARAAGEYQKLYDQEKAAREKAEADLAQERLTGLRGRIAAQHNLPADLADRLRGDDEAAIEADAKKLAATVTARKGGGADGGAGNTGTPAVNMNDAIRRAAGRR